MLWLIWIVLMVVVPVGAGVHVWWNLHETPREADTAQRIRREPGGR
jgi:hypothetical protein